MEKEPTPKKTYLYHRVPEDMKGNILHPLNILKDINPELYLVKAKKYSNREHVMQQFIPTLECAWNDVLHFSVINPKELKEALVESGMKPKEMKFYQIDPSLLDPKNTTIYIFKYKEKGDKMNPENFIDYDPDYLDEHTILPETTKNYYKEIFKKGEKPLVFMGVSHILYKGSIDISNLPVITV